ncbi:MAG: prepilin-type N-terminal cleavage/methylation domain-containing protein [Pseudomonadota bacterium]
MRFKSNRGFTLVEIIITLTVTAILATMIYTYFGEAFLQSVVPVTRLKSSAALQGVMENITADYNVHPKWRSGTLYAAGAFVIPTNFNGFYYQCTAGTSGTSEPIWPLGITPYTETTGTGVQWTKIGRLRTLLSLSTLQTRIGAEGTDQDNAYGKYNVIRNRFTRFVNDIDQDSDASGANNILKVTLKNDNGETQTALFVSD